jgi:hypothetical protein
VPTTKNPSHYQELVTALSNKYKVDIVVWADTEEKLERAVFDIVIRLSLD